MTYDQYLQLLERYENTSYVKDIQRDTLIKNCINKKYSYINVNIPHEMNPAVYLSINKRMLAIKRRINYLNKRNDKSNSEIYDDETIAEKVCLMYNIKNNPKHNERYTFILRRAKYTYLCNDWFSEEIKNDMIKNNKILKVIDENWIVPDMEDDPLRICDNEIDHLINNQLKYIDKYVDP